MRRLLLILALLLAALPARATEVIGPGQVLRGRFVQERVLTGFARPLVSEGRFILVPGRGLLWLAETPFAVTTTITGAGLVQQSGGAETLRLQGDRVPFLARLYDVLGGALAGDWKALEQQFSVQRQGTTKAWRVVLTPRSDGLPFSTITLEGGRFVEHVEMAKLSGDVDRLRFVEQTLTGGAVTPDEDRLLRQTAP